MLHTCAARLADMLLRHVRQDQNRYPIYVYGMELLLSSTATTLSLLILSLLLNRIDTFLIFFIIFSCCRFFSGGYHAPTYLRCFLFTNTVYLSVFGCALLIAHFQLGWLLPIIAGLSCITILALAPVTNPNHPLSAASYHRNKTISHITTVLLFLGWGALTLLHTDSVCVSFYVFTIMAVAIMMIIPKHTKAKEGLT